MKLTILGSGTFFVTKDVSASAFVLDTGKKKILVDCGPGTLMRLSQAGFEVTDLDYAFITHFHPDHTSDLFPLFMNFRLTDVFEPGTLDKYPVFCGPVGLDKFMMDYSHLTQLHGYENWDKIEIVEYKEVNEFDGFVVKAYEVVHPPFGFQGNAYALRFEVDGKAVAFSGDCAKCDGVEKACQDADLFVCDCSMPKGDRNNVHMTSDEIGEISRDGKVKKLILDHFYPSFADFDLAGEVKEVYKGEVIKAKDLEVIEV